MTRIRNSRASVRWRFVGCVALALGCGPLAEGGRLALVPLCQGLTIVTAISQRAGDYESIKTVDSIGAADVSLKYSSEAVENDVLRRLSVRRHILPADLRSATSYMHHFSNRAALTIPGTTAIGTSTAVLRSLKAGEETEFGIFEKVGASAPTDPNVSPNVYDYRIVATIRRVEPDPVPLSITVNDAPAELPAIHARGDFFGDQGDFYFLDDERNPITLKYRIGSDTLDVVKIDYRCPAESATDVATSSPGSRLERSLIETGRAEIYSIYFSFNSDSIREESEPTLREIADVLARHPDWNLAIQGHTDSVASESYNLELSKRRAAAVKTDLVSVRGVSASRLTTDGFGESQPRDRNDTLEGRARNRRVELVRLP